MVSKPKLTMRLFWESKDLDYDREDRYRYTKIRRIVNKVPTKVFKKLFITNKDYGFYRGFCIAKEVKEILTESEYEIALAVIENIKCGYYNKGDTK